MKLVGRRFFSPLSAFSPIFSPSFDYFPLPDQSTTSPQAGLHMGTITNPILPGFNPDPSICRVGEDYYIATSTFEWYPGVQIFHSKDLENWRLVARPLNRASLLDMRGAP